MSNIVNFPQRPEMVEEPNALNGLESRIKKRFGVSLLEFVGDNGKRSEEVQQRIDRSLRKETMIIASIYE